jgi:hypothetical protein
MNSMKVYKSVRMSELKSRERDRNGKCRRKIKENAKSSYLRRKNNSS